MAEGYASSASLLEAAAAHYHATLKGSAAVLGRIKWTGAVGAELVEHFRLGFCDGTLRARLGLRGHNDVELDRALVDVGLVRTNGVEAFSGSLVIPVFGERGEVVALRGGAYHPYSASHRAERQIPLGDEPIFHRSGIIGPEVIVTASALDALRFWYAGHVEVTAASRHLTVSDTHVALLQAAKVERVLLAWRPSSGGEAAALSAAQRLAKAGIHTYRVRIERRYMPSSRQWGQMLASASSMLGAPPRPGPPLLDVDWRRTGPGRPGGAR